MTIWASQVVLVVKNLPANAGDRRDMDSTPGLGRSHGGGHGNPLQYSCPKKPMNRGPWWATSQNAAITEKTKYLTWVEGWEKHGILKRMFCVVEVHVNS